VITQEQWIQLINRYRTLKKLFIECEETDPELKTNLQPMNELRAALDHLIRIVAIEKLGSLEHSANSQYDKLMSHIRRAFFDVCDMLTINYRNKIVSLLEPYDPSVIMSAVDRYYSEIRPFIEGLDLRIVDYRTRKGKEDIEDSIVVAYEQDTLKLKEYYLDVLKCLEALNDLQAEKKSEKTANDVKSWAGYIIGIAGIIVGVLIAIFL